MSKVNKKRRTTSSIEKRYKKLDPHKHVLKRPGMYIGSIKEDTAHLWVCNKNRTENDPLLVYKEITYVPGLYKIYDEILVNAHDHTHRCHTCNIIKVNIDQKTGRITVWNNGKGIDIAMHKKHKMLVPSLIFGELLSGTNYDDTEKRTVGGMNGLGAKLANIYSTEFEVETTDIKRKRKFSQLFTNNMYTKHKPKVTKYSKTKSYTRISFIPDYAKFGLVGLTDDIFALFKKRVYDVAMTSAIKVYYNEELIESNTFTKYIDLYFPKDSEHKKVIDVTKANTNWKVCVVFDPTDQIEHQTISFVNGICTSRGGTHVDHVVNQVVKQLQIIISKRAKDLMVKPIMIKENLIFFVDATLVNPEFDSQTKEFLKYKVADFGSNYLLTESFVKKIAKTGVVDQILANAQAKADANLGKLGKGFARYSKLYGAHKANKREGYKCTLILTEGDSAKSLAMAGSNVIGRDYYGVFPLRGKLLNVRDAGPLKLARNEEIKAIINIMGLEPKKLYQNTVGLKYGSIMVMADQDTDGTHIKALIMNFIHHFWPSLMKNNKNKFIKSFVTPLVKVSKGSGKKKKVIEFANEHEFETWKADNSEGKGWVAKYYKGLGTSTPQEAQDYFRNLDNRQIQYYWPKPAAEPEAKPKRKRIHTEIPEQPTEQTEQTEQTEPTAIVRYVPKNKDLTEDAFTLAFADKREDDRKLWLNTYDAKAVLDPAERHISYYDFIHKELIVFSIYSTARAVPHLMDGFKPSLRKIYYGSVKKNIYKTEIKVEQLAGYISEHTAYHHGEASLKEAIVGMAQDFVGSNNINLLVPIGQFGSRLCGGKDAASPRYIHTKLDALAKKIFIDNDYDILDRQFDDKKEIEPTFYAPIIPMILVNGVQGIGTGYSSTIEPCNPRDICANIKRLLNGEQLKRMKPWYRHFTGAIEKMSKNKYISRAKYEVIGNDTIHITDLPVGIWTDNYKAFLTDLLASPDEKSTKSTKSAKSAKSTKSAKSGSKKSTKRTKTMAKRAKKSGTARVAKNNTIGKCIKTYREDCTDVIIDFTIEFHPGKLAELMANGKLETNLKLVTKLNLTNMHLFDEHGKIRKYKSYNAILENFATVRLVLYQKRKDYLLGKWRKEIDMLKWKIKFIDYVIEGKIVIFKDGKSKKKTEVIAKLEELNFPQFVSGNKADYQKTETEEEDTETAKPSYRYITTIGLFHLTTEEVDKLKQQLAERKEEIATLEGKMPTDLWTEELEEFMIAYDQWEKACDEAYQDLLAGKKKGRRTRKQNKEKEKEVVEV